jgi:hypothetical protein
MGPAYFVIAIMGCADGGAACTPVATLPTEYATPAACAAETATALESNASFDFPTLTAQCRETRPTKAAAERPNQPAGARRG